MKKRILIALLAVIASLALVFCFAACTEKEKTNDGIINIEEAYAQAAQLGYTGTLDEFIELISGKDGADGKDGVGIVSTLIDDNGELVIVLSNGTVQKLGVIVGNNGTDGKDGLGIKSVELNSDGELIITYTDDTFINLGKITGENGSDGSDGVDGSDGKDGLGIKSVDFNANGEIVITYTDDTSDNLGKIACVHNYSDWTLGIEPSCESIGYNFRTCSLCGHTEYEFTEAAGHNWDNGTVVFDADCTKNGLLYYTCENCGETRTEIIYATGEHVFVNGSCIYCNVGRAKIIDGYYNGNYGLTYFSKLNNGEKFIGLYSEMDEEVIRFHNSADMTVSELSFDFEKYGLSKEEAVSVWKTYLDDKPLYYWISKTLSVSGGYINIKVDSEFTDGKTRTEYNEMLYKLIGDYSSIAIGESAYSVAFAYHDLIIDSIDYAYNGNVPESAEWAHNITGVFEGKGAVCEGYARAFSLLLNMRDIENIFVTGRSCNESHAWNLVKLDDGNWYWYDLTFDDTPNSYWGISHTYFCVTDEEFLKTHTADSPSVFGTAFLCELPVRATGEYSGEEIKYLDSFSDNGIDYLVTGYNYANVSYITSGGNCVIPEMVRYKNSDFDVISIIYYDNYYNKGFMDGTVLDYKVDFISVSIPSTVRYIHQNALRSNYVDKLEEIIVDENNKVFCAVDGVLFTKSLYTLITYPSGNKRTQYAIPDETYIIEHNAIENTCLELLKIGKNVSMAGVVNWGDGYIDNESGDNGVIKAYSVITGAWNKIVHGLAENAVIVVDEENDYFAIKDKILYNKSFTYVHAAFSDIEEIVLPDTVTDMENQAFEQCKKLKSIVLPSEIRSISSFEYCESLEEIVIPEGITKLDDRMFYNCTALKTVVIPKSITYVGGYAFKNCISLESLTIPAGVNYIGTEAFSNTALGEITIAEGNDCYEFKNGCLIEIASKILIHACDNCVIPDDGSVEVIGECAFYLNNAEEIVIPYGVKTIERFAFENCKSLKKLVVSSSILSVGNYWLINTYDLEIFVEFTEEQWKDLYGDYVNEQYTARKYYFYSEEKPEAEGNFWHYVDGEITIWED